MNENSLIIKIIAAINRKLSEKKIKSDIQTLENTPFYINLTAKLNKDKSRQQLQRDLQNIGGTINVDVNLDRSQVESEIQNTLQNIHSSVNVDINADNIAQQGQDALNNNPLNIPIDESSVQRQCDNVGNIFNNTFKSISSQLLTFFSINRAFAETVKNVQELDNAIYNLQVATGKNRNEVVNLIQDYNDLARQLSVTTVDISQSADSFLRQGYNLQETNKLIESSTILAKDAQLSNANATEYLTSIMHGYKTEASDAISIVDSLTAVDLESATSAGELSEAIARVASTAKLQGVELNDLIGYIATVSETTRRSASTIGNSFNSIFSRLNNIKAGKFVDDETGESLNDVENVLDKLGIKMRDTNGIFKDTSIILRDVADNWKTFDKNQQNAIATAAAGTYQRNNFIALMENYSRAMELSETAANSSGIALKKYDAYVESLDGKINRLKANIEGLTLNIIDDKAIKNIITANANIVAFVDKTNLLKTGLNGLIFTGIVKGITTLGIRLIAVKNNIVAFNSALNISRNINTTANAIANLSSLTTNLTDRQFRLVLSSQQLTQAQRIQILQTQGLTQAEAQARLQTLGLATATTTAETATVGLSGAFTTLKTVIASNPIGLLIIGLTTATTVIQSYNRKLEEKAEAEKKAMQQSVENSKMFKSELDTIDSLNNRYIDSITSANSVAEAKHNLQSIQEELTEQFQNEADTIDIVNGKYAESIQAMQDLKKETAEKYLFDNSAQINAAMERQQNEYINGRIAKITFDKAGTFSSEFLNKLIQETGQNISFFENGLIDGNVKNKTNIKQFNIGGNYADAYENLKKMAEMYEEIEQKQGTYNSTIHQKIIDTANEIKTIIDNDNLLFEQSTAAEKILNESNPLDNIENQVQFNKLLQQAIDLKQKFFDTDSSIDKYNKFKELGELEKQLYNIADGNTDLQNIVNDTFDSITDNITQANSVIDIFDSAFTDNIPDNIKNNIELINEFKDALSNLSQDKTISSNTAWKLFDSDINKNIQSIQQINGEYKLSSDEVIKAKDAIISKTEEEIKSEISKIQVSVRATKQIISANESLLKLKQEQLAEYNKTHTVNSSADLTEITEISEQITAQKNELSEYENMLRKYNLYLSEINSNLGDTVNTADKLKSKSQEIEGNIKLTKETISQINNDISELQQAQKNLQKAEESEVQGVIDKLKERENILKNEKQDLEAERDILIQQKNEIEEIIKKYDKTFSIIAKISNKEKELLKSQKDSEIDKIKSFYDEQIQQLQEQNEEREKAISLAEKQANLENAQRNKVRQYNEQTGWTYTTNSEAVSNAQNDLNSLKSEMQIDSLEKEKENKISDIEIDFDNQIKALEEYISIVSEATETMENAENDIIASEIMGSDWLEKIKNKDTNVLQQLINARSNYQNKIDNTIQQEIKSIENVIKSKQAEIDINSDTMQQWNEYKSKLQQFVNNSENSWNSYIDSLNTIKVNENSNFDERIANFEQFQSNYNNIASQLFENQNELNNATSQLETYNEQLEQTKQNIASFNESEAIRLESQITQQEENANFALSRSEYYKSIAGTNAQDYGRVNYWNDKYNEYMLIIDELQRQLQNVPRYATGGVNTTTGFAWLDGTPNKPELVLNNSEAAKLYNLLSKFSTDELYNKFHFGEVSPQLQMNLKALGESTTINKKENTQNITLNFNGNIVTNNPTDFMQQMNKYIQHNRLNSKINYNNLI